MGKRELGGMPVQPSNILSWDFPGFFRGQQICLSRLDDGNGEQRRFRRRSALSSPTVSCRIMRVSASLLISTENFEVLNERGQRIQEHESPRSRRRVSAVRLFHR